jgi:hypothetical protein
MNGAISYHSPSNRIHFNGREGGTCDSIATILNVFKCIGLNEDRIVRVVAYTANRLNGLEMKQLRVRIMTPARQ